MTKTAFGLIVAVAWVAAAPAQAVTATVDFTGHASGDTIGNTYSPLGLSFEDGQFLQCGGGCPAPDPSGWFAYNGGSAFAVNFATPQSAISFQTVSFTDTLAEAFDAGNSLVGSVTEHQGFPVSELFNSLTGTAFVRVVFSDAGGDGSGPGITNLTFETGSFNGGVPEPATWAMMLAGFGLIGATMRRRQKVAVRHAF